MCAGCGDALYRSRIRVVDEENSPIAGANIISTVPQECHFGVTDTSGILDVGMVGVSKLKFEISKVGYQTKQADLQLIATAEEPPTYQVTLSKPSPKR
jgi:hypothetical protein